MEINFWNSENMLQFWSYVRLLLEGISPGILITVAVVAVGLLLGIVVKAWAKSSDDQLRERGRDEDDDIEFRRY